MNSTATPYADIQLTPAEYLAMEALIARARLGESYWTFPSSITPTARRLEALGLIGWKSGIVERTILMWIRDDVRTELLSYPYEPPSGTVNISTEELALLRRDLAEACADRDALLAENTYSAPKGS